MQSQFIVNSPYTFSHTADTLGNDVVMLGLLFYFDNILLSQRLHRQLRARMFYAT